MAKVVIAELDIDIQALLKTTSDLKKEIDKIKNSQKELAASGQASSEAFVENEAVLKTLTGAYSQNIKAIQESGKATAQQTDQTELLNLALTQEATSIQEARDQNKLLNKLRNETNTTTKEGQAQLTALNAKLDANNEYIKENADQYLKQKINIGNYSESVKDALASLNPFNGGLSGFTQRAQEAGGAGNLLKNAFMQITTGIYGMVKSSLAFIATPIGAIIAAIVVVATTMYNIFKSFTPIVDKVEQIFAGLSATLSVVKNTIISLVTGAQSLGSAFSSLSGDMNKAYDSAVALKQAQQDLDDAIRQTDLTSAKARVEINKLNIQAKDRTKTEAERLAILERAEALEKTVGADRKKNALEALRIAEEQIRINLKATDQEIKNLETNFSKTKAILEEKGTNVDKYTDDYIAAQKAVYEAENQTTVELEKNINKQNKLIDDAEAKQEKANAVAEARRQKQAEAAQKRIDDAITQQESELRLLQEKTRFEEDQIKRAETLAIKEIEILKDKLKNKKISQTEYDTENLRIQNDIVELQKQKDAEELQRFVELEEKKKLHQEEIDARKAEKAAIDLENSIAATENEFLQMQADFDRAYKAEIAAAEKTGADVNLINKKYANFQKQIDQELLASKLDSYRQTFNQIGSLFGENTILAKAAAIAEVGISTYQKAFESFAQAKVYFSNPLTVSLGVNAAIQGGLTIAQGAATAAKISGVKFEQGGIQEIGGKRHSAGGTKFYGEDGTMFEAERGEGIGILNRGAYSAFMNFNNQFGSGKSGNGMFEGGGIITQGVKPEQANMASIIDAILSIPAPVVAVEEIQTVGQRYVSVKANADF